MRLVAVICCRRLQPSSSVHRIFSGISMDKPTETAHDSKDSLTMQIVVRRDLLDAEGWGVGPLMAQAAHAATAILHHARDLEATKVYLSDLQNMRKVVLQTSSELSLSKLANMLSKAEPPIPYYLWTEQPENVPTCLALAPNRRESRIKKALDKTGCRLWQG